MDLRAANLFSIRRRAHPARRHHCRGRFLALSRVANEPPRAGDAGFSECRALPGGSDEHRYILLLMTFKHLLGLLLICLSLPMICATASLSRRARELAFFVMLAGWV